MKRNQTAEDDMREGEDDTIERGYVGQLYAL